MTLNVAVVGAGTMGVGIAYVFAAHGAAVTVVEPEAGRVVALRRTVEAVAQDGVARGRLPADVAASLADGITHVPDVSDLRLGLDLVVESVPESPELKQRVLAAAEKRQPAALATNTSTLSIDTLASALERPQSFLGMHFFNPVWSLHLVEVIRGARTDDATLERALGAVALIGKQPAVVHDMPGFATSRLDITTALEAIRMVEQGVAPAADIDRAIRLAYRHPVGPLHLSDIVGLDVRLHTAIELERTLGPRFAPPELLRQMVARGELGRKSGRGFYTWEGDAVIDA
jgi:3-hydroxybutyryl-CoA dehydrogenase